MRLAFPVLVLAMLVVCPTDGTFAHAKKPDIAVPEGVLGIADAKAAKKAFQAAEKNNWKAARRTARKIKDPLTIKMFKWFGLRSRSPDATFAEISAFIADNPDWPSNKTLRTNAEAAMLRNLDPYKLLDWFDKYPPVSTDGWVSYAWALLKTGRKDKARSVIRDIWINRNFAKHPEKSFYRNYRRYLTSDDHVKRLERLLWEGRNWPVRRMLWKVKPELRAMAEARLMLRHKFGNVDTAIAKVPAALKNHPGLVYERLRWRRSKGRYEDAADLLVKSLDTSTRPDLWARERTLLARMALAKGNITDAYRLASPIDIAEGPEYADAEWLAGWIALRFLKEPKIALKHFIAMFEGVKYPISRARGAYWASRAAAATGDSRGADMWQRIAARRQTTYYGQLAGNELGANTLSALPQPPDIPADQLAEFNNLELVRVLEIATQIGARDPIRPFFRALANKKQTPAWRSMTAALANRLKRPDQAIAIAKRASRDGSELIEAGYPELTPPALLTRTIDTPVEIPLVLAMIRQESAFYASAKSHANARGLMQILPRTASRVARLLRIPYSRDRLIEDPEYNMIIGQAYMSGLLDEFDGSYVLSLAAYNAGPSRARRWTRKYGNPGSDNVDAVDWVELIPFKETRNYVQRVLENLQVYRRRLAGSEVAETLHKDLIR